MPADDRIYIQEDHRPQLSANGKIFEFPGADLLDIKPQIIYELIMR